MSTILIVDDEANIRRMLARLLEAEGYVVTDATDGRAALAAVAVSEPDAVLLDLAMPGMDGIEALGRLGEAAPALPVVMMSGRASLADAVRATKLGAFHFIEKPLAPEAVLLSLKNALELRRARELSQALTAELTAGQELVGSSPAMRRTRELIARVAPTDARVLLTGESGTGKELAAAAVHGHSARSGGAFVRVNSAALPHELIESELFGHERGAFTGAAERRRGRFELADGGTLFLDEVADLGAGAQAKLLRALETGEIERLGGEKAIRVDVRVIAATNRDLDDEMRAGRFREDLFYRLNVVPIELPPLRDRLEDLEDLVAHLFARLRDRQGLRPPTLSADALLPLRSYPWPGNVRELANICERLTILFPDRIVEADNVTSVLPASAGASTHDLAHASLNERLAAFERREINDALNGAEGNVAVAAKRLRTDRANLYRRMRRLGIER